MSVCSVHRAALILLCLFFSFSVFFFQRSGDPRVLHSFPTRRSSDLSTSSRTPIWSRSGAGGAPGPTAIPDSATASIRSEEHTPELQSQSNLVCRLLREKKKAPYSTRTQSTPHQPSYCVHDVHN